jgi:exopolysaccharide biosynthesis predicted pyruvyltransferase EpsI
VHPNDIVFFNSGGNMNETATLTEPVRRILLQRLNGCKIVQLPQTISFSDTDKGRIELEATRRSLMQEGIFTLIARDRVSESIAKMTLGVSRCFACPDFALTINPRELVGPLEEREGSQILCCFRDKDDTLNVLGAEAVACLESRFPGRLKFVSTLLDHPVPRRSRARVLARVLSQFASAKIVVTDRFHGVIFGLICLKPTIAIATRDHKMSAGVEWFQELENLKFVDNVPDLERSVTEFIATPPRVNRVDWTQRHFSDLHQRINAFYE